LASILDRFKDFSIGSSGRTMDYRSIISSGGDFTKVFDMDAILVSWNNILTTPKGSMDHDPLFGSNLYKYVFEPCDDTSREGIENEILSCLGTYDDRARVTDIKVEYYSNKKGFVVSIIAEYSGKKSKMKITLDETSLMNFT